MMQNSSMIMSKISFDNQWRKALVREERGVVAETIMIGGCRKAFGTSVERRLEANGDDKIVRCEILKWKIWQENWGAIFGGHQRGERSV
eukprot:scaffold29424_cov54-Cyclotella_meneghiniana.AAC.1